MSILDPLIVSPRLPRFYEQIGALLQTERERRCDFYERVTQQIKAEFINGEMIVHSPVKLRHIEAGRHLLLLIVA